MSAKTSFKSLLKRFKKKAITYSIFAASSTMIASPAFAASVNFSNWTGSGDFTTSLNQATLTNAFSDGSDDGGANYNVSGNNPNFFIDDLETFIGIAPGSLGVDATEGSVIKTIFTGVQAGDVFSFDWDFLTYDTVNADRAFVAIGNSILNLTSGTPFSYTFNTGGNYTVGIGVIDVNDTTGSSRLALRNGNYEPVPEPLTVFGSLAAFGFGAAMKRRLQKKTSA
ncbi:hypothetical protein NIES4071_27470 [Calothrix sp. NIES-4071]|nr:hypothetical protein NIES4071_27470 [Calothrix sp. NIES-4071]BAZ57069.1 hypothetical protein NIES4105_27410 [Calothrix sp. NIES-4105]